MNPSLASDCDVSGGGGGGCDLLSREILCVPCPEVEVIDEEVEVAAAVLGMSAPGVLLSGESAFCCCCCCSSLCCCCCFLSCCCGMDLASPFMIRVT